MKLLVVVPIFLALASSSKLSFLPQLDGRIVGGDATTIEEYPYQISLEYDGRHICGGSILSESYIITAAHCTDGLTIPLSNTKVLSIRAGSSLSGRGGTVILVKRIIQNPKYDKKSVDYDISILELSEKLQYSSSIQPVNLPEFNAKLPEGTESVCTGWGARRENGASSTRLQTVTVPLVSHEVCKDSYGNNAITDRMICAGFLEGGKDACQGDSGGPLVANGDLIGIVSWGYGCARPNYPGVYSNVANLRDFIQNETGI